MGNFKAGTLFENLIKSYHCQLTSFLKFLSQINYLNQSIVNDQCKQKANNKQTRGKGKIEEKTGSIEHSGT